MRKPSRLVGAALLPALLVCGCASMSNTEKGVGPGAAPVSGGLAANTTDRSEQKPEAQLVAATAPAPQGPLGLTEVAHMAQSHVSDEVIVSQIRSTEAVFQLSAGDTIWLKQNGVSDAVVQEMLLTANRRP